MILKKDSQIDNINMGEDDFVSESFNVHAVNDKPQDGKLGVPQVKPSDIGTSTNIPRN